MTKKNAKTIAEWAANEVEAWDLISIAVNERFDGESVEFQHELATKIFDRCWLEELLSESKTIGL